MSAPTVNVFGAGGFAGALAAHLLHRHPEFELRALTARSDAGIRLDELYPRYRVPLELEEFDVDRHADVDAAIVAYPHGAAAPVVAALRERDVRVVDLSADFRLRDRDTYERWYGEHGAPELFGTGAYGLTELNRDAVRDADIVANPGCYPTATLLGLAPLARAGLIGDAIIDAKSGVSGAGRAATQKTHFVSADENVNAYGIPGHRHAPEIDQSWSAATSRRRATPMTPSCRSSTARPTMPSRSSNWPPGRRGCATCATPTSAASSCTTTCARTG
jgi:N-acetyl-gamma-glutamyl-phosphate reductase